MIKDRISPLPENVNYIYFDATEDKFHVLFPVFPCKEIPIQGTNNLKSIIYISAQGARNKLSCWNDDPISTIILELNKIDAHLLSIVFLLNISNPPKQDLIEQYTKYRTQITTLIDTLQSLLKDKEISYDNCKAQHTISRFLKDTKSNLVSMKLCPNKMDCLPNVFPEIFSLARQPDPNSFFLPNSTKEENQSAYNEAMKFYQNKLDHRLKQTKLHVRDFLQREIKNKLLESFENLNENTLNNELDKMLELAVDVIKNQDLRRIANDYPNKDYILFLPPEKINIAIQAFIGFTNVKYYEGQVDKKNFGILLEEKEANVNQLIQNIEEAFVKGLSVERTILNTLKELLLINTKAYQKFFEKKSDEIISSFKEFFIHFSNEITNMNEFWFLCERKTSLFYKFKNNICIPLERYLKGVTDPVEHKPYSITLFNNNLPCALQQINPGQEYTNCINKENLIKTFDEALNTYQSLKTQTSSQVTKASNYKKAILNFLYFKDENGDFLYHQLRTEGIREKFLAVMKPTHIHTLSPNEISHLISHFKRTYHFFTNKKDNFHKLQYVLSIYSKSYFITSYTESQYNIACFRSIKLSPIQEAIITGKQTYRISYSMTYWLLKSRGHKVDICTKQDFLEVITAILDIASYKVELVTNTSTLLSKGQVLLQEGRVENEFYLTASSVTAIDKISEILNKACSQLVKYKKEIKGNLDTLNPRPSSLSLPQEYSLEINNLKKWILLKKYLHTFPTYDLNSRNINKLSVEDLCILLRSGFPNLNFVINNQLSNSNSDTVYTISEFENNKFVVKSKNNLSTINAAFNDYLNINEKAYNKFLNEVKKEVNRWNEYFNEWESIFDNLFRLHYSSKELNLLKSYINKYKNNLARYKGVNTVIYLSYNYGNLNKCEEDFNKIKESYKTTLSNIINTEDSRAFLTQYINVIKNVDKSQKDSLEKYIETFYYSINSPLFIRNKVAINLQNLQSTIFNYVVGTSKQNCRNNISLIDKLTAPSIPDLKLYS